MKKVISIDLGHKSNYMMIFESGKIVEMIQIPNDYKFEDIRNLIEEYQKNGNEYYVIFDKAGMGIGLYDMFNYFTQTNRFIETNTKTHVSIFNDDIIKKFTNMISKSNLNIFQSQEAIKLLEEILNIELEAMVGNVKLKQKEVKIGKSRLISFLQYLEIE